MIYLYPADFMINRRADDSIIITFDTLRIDTGADIVNIDARLRALCTVFRDCMQTTNNLSISDVWLDNSTVRFKNISGGIASSCGFTELVSAVFTYDLQFKDNVFIKLVKSELIKELKRSKLTGEKPVKLTAAESEKVVDTMIYNWITMVAQRRGLLNAVKLQRTAGTKLKPSLISSGIPMMEMYLKPPAYIVNPTASRN